VLFVIAADLDQRAVAERHANIDTPTKPGHRLLRARFVLA
jgi:hypothetical protein